MTKKTRRCFRSCAALLFAAASLSWADVALEPISPKLTLSANVRTRWELWNFFEARNGADNDYDFVGTRGRLGLRWADEVPGWLKYEVFAEGQVTGLIDMPAFATGAPGGPLGAGALYRAQNNGASDSSLFLKQGYLRLRDLGVEGTLLQGGRFEFADGAEVQTKDPTLDWLRNFRLAERLIGPFGWSHVSRSFDGGLAAMTRGPWNLTAMYVMPTQGGFALEGNSTIDKIDLVYAALNLTRPAVAPHSDARLFYVYYGDGRGLTKVDNRPAAALNADRHAISIHTAGAHVIQTVPSSAGPLDLLGWGAVQYGNWGTLDQASNAWALEAGWQPEPVAWKPWIRVGWNRSSGDDDPLDGTHGTFFQILPTARQYSWSTFYNLMNNDDLFTQLILRPAPGLVWRTDYHFLQVSETRDLWYFGSGATLANRQAGFGYGGRPSSGAHPLMQVIETQVSYQWNAHLNTVLYYGHEFGESVVRGTFANDSADFGYLEFTLSL